MKIKLPSRLLVFLGALVAFNFFYHLNLNAHDHREFGAHVHGAAQLNIAMDSNKIETDLDIPGDDLLGFEHPPATPAEQKTYDDVTNKLKKTYEMFTFPKEAGCLVTSRQLKSTHHEHTEKTTNMTTKQEHLDFEYTVKYTCKDFSKLPSFTVNLFNDFKSLKEIKVALLTTQQASSILTPQNTTVKVVGL